MPDRVSMTYGLTVDSRRCVYPLQLLSDNIENVLSNIHYIQNERKTLILTVGGSAWVSNKSMIKTGNN